MIGKPDPLAASALRRSAAQTVVTLAICFAWLAASIALLRLRAFNCVVIGYFVFAFIMIRRIRSLRTIKTETLNHDASGGGQRPENGPGLPDVPNMGAARP